MEEFSDAIIEWHSWPVTLMHRGESNKHVSKRGISSGVGSSVEKNYRYFVCFFTIDFYSEIKKSEALSSNLKKECCKKYINSTYSSL